MSIDCAENPNVNCIEDADPCVAHAYGCADGSYYLTYPDVTPSGCVEEGGAGMGGLILGDGGPLSFPDADARAEGGD
jgi:hypothetical protein